MSSLIRSSSLTGFSALVMSLGGQPDPLLRQAGIRPEAVGDPDEYIQYRALVTVLDLAARRYDCPDLGLRLSTHQGLDILGPVGVIGRHAASVGDALDGITRFLYQYSPAIEIAVETEGPVAQYHFRIRPRVRRGLIDLAQIGELSLGTSLQIFRMLIGKEFTPRSVSFLHGPAAPMTTYESHFGCPVAAEQDHWGFRFSADVLARPVEGSDPAVRRMVLEYLSGVVGGLGGSGLPAEVLSVVKRALPTRRFGLEDVAESFAVHPRTLQRQLAAHGTTFQEIVDDVRRELADRYLRTTGMPLAQLADVLGYSEQSSFSRSCRRWFGCAPQAHRAASA
ncbi:AraC family transcriptional regulator [Streptomyces sp. NBC_01220]|uniref:AraC family transcriptional regulator n=1 Tax=unclassified Streptomyces TaxID=2593676 RepID=UPI002E2C9D85|nr:MULTISPECIES: AraC family transcriptional regulator [unclassified Streptomyces]WSQ45774.1 AraC family transcriptional regulator [Streptomyces sp. NBC_01220]